MDADRRNAVLILDDQENWGVFLSDILELEGSYKVDLVPDGASALKKLEDQNPPYHLIIVDISLDESDERNQDGLNLIPDLNRLSHNSNIMVVTGHPSIETVRRSFGELNAFDYLEKKPEGKSFDYKYFIKRANEAVVDAERKRADSFVRHSFRILVAALDDTLREGLVDVLKKENYDIERVKTADSLLSSISKANYNLIVLDELLLNRHSELLYKIKKEKIKVMILSNYNIERIMLGVREGVIIDGLSVVDNQFKKQTFRRAIQRSLEAKKYLKINIEEAPGDQLELGKKYTLTFNLQDKPAEDSAEFWFIPTDGWSTTILTLSIYAESLQEPTIKIMEWEIPIGKKPLPQQTVVIAQSTGEKQIVVDLEQERKHLCRLEKTVKIVKKVHDE